MVPPPLLRHWLFLVYILQVPVNSHAKFFTLDELDPKDFFALTSPAHRACVSKSAQLPDVCARSDHLALQKYMKVNNIKCAWVNLGRRNYTTWHWVDGVQASPEIERIGHVTGNICGAVDLEVGRIRMRHCSQKKHPFICEERDCQGCTTRATPGGQCIKIGSICFVYNCAKVGYYDARAICRRSGADLAILRKDGKIRQLEMFWEDGMDSYAWVGLRKEDWERLDVPGDDKTRYTFTPWAAGEPRGHGGKCVQMTRTAGEEYVWRTADCNSNCTVICSHNKTEEEAELTIDEGPGTSISAADKLQSVKVACQASSEPRRPTLSSIPIINLVVNVITMMLMSVLGVYVICSRRYRHTSSTHCISEKTPFNGQSRP